MDLFEFRDRLQGYIIKFSLPGITENELSFFHHGGQCRKRLFCYCKTVTGFDLHQFCLVTGTRIFGEGVSIRTGALLLLVLAIAYH